MPPETDASVKSQPQDHEIAESQLKGKLILVVDDEPDILETLAGILEMSTVHKAPDYETAMQYLMTYTYDICGSDTILPLPTAAPWPA
jgi:PleD family two-component response regulator